MLTTEKAELLTAYMNADEARGKALLELSPSEAAAKISSDGITCTEEDLIEFGKLLRAGFAQAGELDEAALGEVAGGIVVESVAISCIALGYTIGSALAKRFGW